MKLSRHLRNVPLAMLFIAFLLIGSSHAVLAQTGRQAVAKEINTIIGDLGKYNISALYLDDAGAELLYIGTHHTFDPNDVQIAGIELLFKRFSPTLVLVEGGDWPVAENKERAIKRYGELGFVRFLAEKNKVRAQSVDAAPAEEIAAALLYHTPADTKLYYALRYVPQWAKQETGKNIEGNMSALLLSTDFNSRFPVGTPPANVDELTQLTKERLPAMTDWRTVQFNLSFDGAKLSLLTDIDKTVTRFRNAHIEKAILTGLRQGERVFVITGATHLSKIVPHFPADFKVPK